MSAFMLRVAEGIMDEDTGGPFEDALVSAETVIEYGDGLRFCMEHDWGEIAPAPLTTAEGEFIRKTCLAMLARLNTGEFPGSYSWDRDFRIPIRDYDGNE